MDIGIEESRFMISQFNENPKVMVSIDKPGLPQTSGGPTISRGGGRDKKRAIPSPFQYIFLKNKPEYRIFN